MKDLFGPWPRENCIAYVKRLHKEAELLMTEGVLKFTSTVSPYAETPKVTCSACSTRSAAPRATGTNGTTLIGRT
jgi:adenylylsulfate kinase-like enzyme